MKKLILLFSLFGLTAFGALTNIPNYVVTNTAAHTADGFYEIDSRMPESLWALIINRNMDAMEGLKADRTNGVMSKLTVNDWLQVNGTLTVANGRATTLHGPLTVTDDKATFGGELKVNNITDLNGALDVEGISTLREDLIVTADAPTSLDGSLTVGAAGGDQDTTTLYGNLSVLDEGATYLDGTLTVGVDDSDNSETFLNGPLTVGATGGGHDTVNVYGPLNVLDGQAAFLSGATTINSTLGVSGLSTFAAVDINGGTIDNTPIGGLGTRASGAFTTLTSTQDTVLGNGPEDETTIQGKLTVNDNGIDATTVDINGGTIDSTAIGNTIKASGKFTALSSIGTTTLGNDSGDETTIHGKLTVIDNGIIANTADINGGTIDSTAIGNTTRSSGKFTTLSASSGITGTLNGNATTATTATNLNGGSVTATSGSFSSWFRANGAVRLGDQTTDTIRFFGASTGVGQQTASDPALFTSTDNEISGVTIGATYSQSEIQNLRTKCEELGDNCRALRETVKTLTDALQAYGLITN